MKWYVQCTCQAFEINIKNSFLPTMIKTDCNMGGMLLKMSNYSYYCLNLSVRTVTSMWFENLTNIFIISAIQFLQFLCSKENLSIITVINTVYFVLCVSKIKPHF